MFKKKNNNTSNIRKRELSDNSNISEIDPTIPIVTSSSKKSKVADESKEKKPTLNEELQFTTSGVTESLIPKDMMATATSEIDSLLSKDKISVTSDSNLYSGLNSYNNYSLTEQQIKEGKGVKQRYGPMKASSNIRITARFDYQPDVCKDYKETGYCGYGDSCKFLHDRGDYKQGWQIDKEWEEQERKRKSKEVGEEEPEPPKSVKEEQIPFACLICRKSFTDPIKTQCNHYFCEKCAIKHFKKSPKCFACGAATFGIFVPSKENHKAPDLLE